MNLKIIINVVNEINKSSLTVQVGPPSVIGVGVTRTRSFLISCHALVFVTHLESEISFWENGIPQNLNVIL